MADPRSDPGTWPSVYGMLYAASGAEQHANLRAADPITVYVQNAVTMAQSAVAAGMAYRLITNDPERLARIAGALPGGDALALVPFTFSLDVPDGIAFRSAHFKLEVLTAFGTGMFGSHCALLDIDAVLLRPLVLPDSDTLYLYDVSEQMFGAEIPAAAQATLATVAGDAIANPRWFGGEFVAGPALLFKALGEEIAQAWPRYAAQAQSLWHTGDEAVLSVAASRMIERGMAVKDAGTAGLVARWWSLRTANPMRRWSEASQAAVLHLPACKNFLAGDFAPFDRGEFLARHRSFARSRKPRELAKTMVDRLCGRRTYVPQVM